MRHELLPASVYPIVGKCLFVAVCCSVLQCVAVCYSVLQCVAVYCSVLQMDTNVVISSISIHQQGYPRVVFEVPCISCSVL